MEYITPEQLNANYRLIKSLNSKGDVILVSSIENNSLFVKRIIPYGDLSLYKKLAELNLSGIPKLYRYSLIDASLVIIEEYIPGQTLREYLNEYGPMPPHNALDILLKLCDILTPLHQLDSAIIHRDIKPSNVMIAGSGSIYLLDFDAATYYVESKDRDTVLLGTHGYAAPEQYGFNASDPRTDVYALGRLGMELMTGEIHESGSYSGPYNYILKRCTHMDPNRRYMNATALKKALMQNEKNASGFRIPGYRSGSVLLAVLATIAYAIIPISTILNLLAGEIGNFFLGIVFSLAVVLGSMALFNYRDYANFLPFTNSKIPIIRCLARLMYALLIIILVFIPVAIMAAAL